MHTTLRSRQAMKMQHQALSNNMGSIYGEIMACREFKVAEIYTRYDQKTVWYGIVEVLHPSKLMCML